MGARPAILLCCSAFLMVLLPSGAVADDIAPGVDDPRRAEVNYMLHCQGCHGPEGTGTFDGAVPAMNGFVGHFLKVEQGREFLIRVPGSANAAMSDGELAEVLNWMLPRISAAQMPEDFEPYSAAEVARFRMDSLQDVERMRETLIARLARIGIHE